MFFLFIQRGCVISCSNVFYGHASRVWSAEWLSSSLIVSIGEDATTRLWNTSCDMSCDSDKCIHVETGHLVCLIIVVINISY